jgi:hypothetical protein
VLVLAIRLIGHLPHYDESISESAIEQEDVHLWARIFSQPSSPTYGYRKSHRSTSFPHVLRASHLRFQFNVDPLIDRALALVIHHADLSYLVGVCHVGPTIGL